jgi:hypothetical protein
MKRIVCYAILLFCFSSVHASNRTETPSLKGGHYLVPGVDAYRLVVKIKPSLLPEISAGGAIQFPLAKTTEGPVASFGLPVKNNGLKFKRLLPCSAEDLLAARRNGGKLLDAKGFDRYPSMCLFEADVTGIPKERLLLLAKELEQSDLVEYCSLEARENPPPPVAVDFPPATPSFVTRQTYRGPNPGIDVDYGWTFGIRGAGLTISDLEHSWGKLDHATEQVHEDLHNQNIKYGLPWRTDDYRDHGMAVMGLMLAGDNGFGITGSVPQARGLTFSIMHGDAVALKAAIDSSKAGDIVLLEMQRTAPDGKLGPPDVIKTLWDLIKQATARGVVIVETAGNGASNMDDPKYATYHSWGDNGAIIEGAGSADTRHDRLSFSTYGARVNMHGWGSGVFTLGYGGGWSGSTDWRQSYTSSFSGTSSSGPIVTSAVALLQSYAKEKKNRLLTSVQIRDILSKTGTPQGSGGHIGPLPNLKAAIRMVDSLYPITELVLKSVNDKVGSHGIIFSGGRLHYLVPQSGSTGKTHVTISLYNLKGASIYTILDQEKSPGRHTTVLPKAARSNCGTYICSMAAAGERHALKIVIK